MEPKFNVRPKINGSVNIGDRLTIKCEVEADPEPELVWIIGNKDEFHLAILYTKFAVYQTNSGLRLSSLNS